MLLYYWLFQRESLRNHDTMMIVIIIIKEMNHYSMNHTLNKDHSALNMKYCSRWGCVEFDLQKQALNSTPLQFDCCASAVFSLFRLSLFHHLFINTTMIKEQDIICLQKHLFDEFPDYLALFVPALYKDMISRFCHLPHSYSSCYEWAGPSTFLLNTQVRKLRWLQK